MAKKLIKSLFRINKNHKMLSKKKVHTNEILEKSRYMAKFWRSKLSDVKLSRMVKVAQKRDILF